jgi:bidirectional [NiFe] hydrogenase diaphorase subunit
LKEVSLKINGKSVKAQEGTTILEAARRAGVRIPTLCHNDKLEAYGGCRLCMVEIVRKGNRKLVASCVYQVEDNLEVETHSEKVKRIRRMIIELLWPAAQKYASECGVTKSRFRTESTDCSLCGICVRYCAEVKKMHAVYFKGRGIDREVALVPELGRECLYCKECFGFCTGGKILSEMDRLYA